MLDLGFAPQFLYTAYRLEVTFGLPDGGVRAGNGSGFVVVRADGKAYLATARHVVDPRIALWRQPGSTLLAVQMRGWNYAEILADQELVHVELVPQIWLPDDDALDIAVLPLPTAFGGNNCQVRQWIPESLLAEECEFGPDIRVADFLASPGFTDLPGTALDRPVLLTGLIASDPRAPETVTRPGGSESKAVLYQSLSRSGLSGAPVFATQRGLAFDETIKGPPSRPLRLFGINTGSFRDREELPLQFSYFTRSSALLQLLHEV